MPLLPTRSPGITPRNRPRGGSTPSSTLAGSRSGSSTTQRRRPPPSRMPPRMPPKPISVARTAYWQGRTAETFGAHDDARRFYEKAAGYSITYYGQLARAKLGLPEVQLRTVEAAGRSIFEPLPVAQAVKRLYEAGSRDIAFALCADLAASLTDAAHLDALGQLVTDAGDPRTLLTVGKTAVQRGFPLDLHAFPTLGVPAGEPASKRIEKAMVYAITRQ